MVDLQRSLQRSRVYQGKLPIKGGPMSCYLVWNEKKNIFEILTEENGVTLEEVEKMYEPSEELRELIQILKDDPSIKYIEIGDKILVLKR